MLTEDGLVQVEDPEDKLPKIKLKQKKQQQNVMAKFLVEEDLYKQ